MRTCSFVWPTRLVASFSPNRPNRHDQRRFDQMVGDQTPRPNRRRLATVFVSDNAGHSTVGGDARHVMPRTTSRLDLRQIRPRQTRLHPHLAGLLNHDPHHGRFQNRSPTREGIKPCIGCVYPSILLITITSNSGCRLVKVVYCDLL